MPRTTNKSSSKTRSKPARVKQPENISHFTSDIVDLEKWIIRGALIMLLFVMMGLHGAGSDSCYSSNTLSSTSPTEVLASITSCLKHWVYALQYKVNLKVPLPKPIYCILNPLCCTKYDVKGTSHNITWKLPQDWETDYIQHRGMLSQLFGSGGFFSTRFGMTNYIDYSYQQSHGTDLVPVKLMYSEHCSNGTMKAHVKDHRFTGNLPIKMNDTLHGCANVGTLNNSEINMFMASILPNRMFDAESTIRLTQAFDVIQSKMSPAQDVESGAHLAFTLVMQGGSDNINATSGHLKLAKDVTAVDDSWIAMYQALISRPAADMPNVLPPLPNVQSTTFAYLCATIMQDPALFMQHLSDPGVKFLKFVRHLHTHAFKTVVVPNCLSESICMAKTSFMTKTNTPSTFQTHIIATPFWIDETAYAGKTSKAQYNKVFQLFKHWCNESSTGATTQPEFASITTFEHFVELCEFMTVPLTAYCMAFDGWLRTAPVISKDHIGISSKVMICVNQAATSTVSSFDVDLKTSFTGNALLNRDSPPQLPATNAFDKILELFFPSEDGDTQNIDASNQGGADIDLIAWAGAIIGAKPITPGSNKFRLDRQLMKEQIKDILQNTERMMRGRSALYSKYPRAVIYDSGDSDRYSHFLRPNIAIAQNVLPTSVDFNVVYNSPQQTAINSAGFHFIGMAPSNLAHRIPSSCIATKSGQHTELYAQSTAIMSKYGGFGSLFKMMGKVAKTVAHHAPKIAAQAMKHKDIIAGVASQGLGLLGQVTGNDKIKTASEVVASIVS